MNALWLFFWMILIIILLGLIFGGYRKGTKENGLWQPAARAFGSAAAPGPAAAAGTGGLAQVGNRR